MPLLPGRRMVSDLVFCANYDKNFDVYTLNIDGSDLQRITDHDASDFIPEYSPDGKSIIYTSQEAGNDDIWLHDLSTGKSRQITEYTGRDFSPTFSPDGKIIAYVSGDIEKDGSENLRDFHIGT